MKLIPIAEKLEENQVFAHNPLCTDILSMTIEFYKRVGFVLPWIGYFAKKNGEFVGSAGFKGAPVNGTVEIAYGTFEQFRKKGFGTEICKQMVLLPLKADASIKITARTIAQQNFSTKILEKNNFKCIGTVNDSEDGEVWEWLFISND